jgi:hypothetical protein
LAIDYLDVADDSAAVGNVPFDVHRFVAVLSAFRFSAAAAVSSERFHLEATAVVAAAEAVIVVVVAAAWDVVDSGFWDEEGRHPRLYHQLRYCLFVSPDGFDCCHYF